MKIRNLIIMAVALMLAFTACEDNEYEAPNDLSAVGWYTSNFRNEEFMIGINDFISFSDLSQGAVTHTWTIPEGAYFLEGPITRNDTVLENFIIPNAGNETTDKTIHVLFTKSGLQPVRLHNTFHQKVVFFGRDTLEAVQEGDLWVIDTTFMVDVLDTIVPQILIRQDGVEVPVGPDTIYVEAGTSLEFIDVTTIGRPNTWEWRVAGEASSDSAATILFKKLGVFEAVLNISRTGQNIPADYDRYVVPNPIKVIPSSKPWVLLGDIHELEDETIQLVFNGEFQPFVNQEDYFVVTVNGEPFEIESVTIDPNDATILNIKLVEPIYRPDVITVTLLPGSDIRSTDFREPTPFTDVPVIMSDINIMDELGASFEDELGDTWIYLPPWGNKGVVEYTTEKATHGSKSAKLDLSTGSPIFFESKNDPFTLEANKTYIISYDVYIEPGSEITEWTVWFFPDWGDKFWFGGSSVEQGKWVTITRETTKDVERAGRNIGFRLIGTSGVMYIDNFHIVEKEVRP